MKSSITILLVVMPLVAWQNSSEIFAELFGQSRDSANHYHVSTSAGVQMGLVWSGLGEFSVVLFGRYTRL